MNTHDEKKIPEDEIDLGSLGKRAASLISYPFRLLASNLKTTLAFIVLAVALSISLKYILPKTYKSSFVIRPSDITDKLYLKILADLPALLKEKDYTALSELLKFRSTEVSDISGIKFVTTFYRAGADSSNYSEIILEVKDPDLFIPLQNSILNYLENNPYYLKIRNLQKAQIEMSLKQINADAPQLDSLKKMQLIRYSEKAQSSNDALLGSMVNSAAIYSVSMERVDRKSKLMAQQVFIDRFQLIKNCAISNYPDFPPRILIMCLILVPFFLLICVIFIHLKFNRSN